MSGTDLKERETQPDSPEDLGLSDQERDAEIAALEDKYALPAAGGGQIGGGYRKEKSGGFSRFFGSRKKLARFGIVGVFLGILLMGLSVLQGPFQFIVISQLLSRFHFSTVSEFGDDRTGKFLIYSLMGKTAKGRLSVTGNFIADSYEKKLNTKGLRSIYGSNGRLIGYEIIDENKAKDFIREMETKDGVSRGAVDGKGLNDTNNRRFNDAIHFRDADFQVRRQVTRVAIKNLEVTKISQIVGSRTLIKRDGVKFHPLNRLKRRFDSEVDKRNHVNEERDARLNGESPDGEISARRKRLNDTMDKIRGFANKAKGPVLVAGVVCAVKDFGSAVDARVVENNKVLLRKGMDYVTSGSQVMSNMDTDMEVLGILHESLYDPETQTSFFDDPGFRAERGEEPNTKDYVEDLQVRGGDYEKPFFLGLVEQFPTSLGPIDACGILNAGDELLGPILGVVESATNSLLNALNLPTPDEIVNVAVSYVAGQAIESARGSREGGLANIGGRLGAGSQARGIGGVEMTPGEEMQLRQEIGDIEHEQFASASIFERYFDVYNSQSLAANILMDAPATRMDAVNGLLFMPSSIGSSLMNMFTPTVHAQTSYNYGFASYGFSPSDRDNALYDNPYQNEEVLRDTLTQRNADEQACAAAARARGENPYPQCEFGYSSFSELNSGDSDFVPGDGDGDSGVGLNGEFKANGQACFSMEVTEAGDLVYGEALDITEVPDEICRKGPGRNIDFMRYRFYLADTSTAHSLACYEGLDASCGQVGFGGSAARAATLPSGEAAELAQQILDNPNIGVGSSYVSQLENIANGQGPCPDVNNGEYQVDPELLRVILALGQNNTFSISSLHRGCTSEAVGSGTKSRHWRGKAVDISGSNPINGATMPNFGAHDDSIQRFVNEAKQLLPANCELGVPNNTYVSRALSVSSACTNLFLDTPSTTGATGPHIHLGVP